MFRKSKDRDLKEAVYQGVGQRSQLGGIPPESTVWFSMASTLLDGGNQVFSVDVFFFFSGDMSDQTWRMCRRKNWPFFGASTTLYIPT